MPPSYTFRSFSLTPRGGNHFARRVSIPIEMSVYCQVYPCTPDYPKYNSLITTRQLSSPTHFIHPNFKLLKTNPTRPSYEKISAASFPPGRLCCPGTNRQSDGQPIAQKQGPQHGPQIRRLPAPGLRDLAAQLPCALPASWVR